jgi:hypothetical protein
VAADRAGGLRFAFYGRVSTEDWQDPVTSLAPQRAQAEALVRGHGRVAAEFSDAGQSRMVAWARRPESPRSIVMPSRARLRMPRLHKGPRIRGMSDGFCGELRSRTARRA